MKTGLIQRLWVGLVVLCCLAVGVAGGTVSESGRMVVIEAEPAIESRSQSTEKQHSFQQLQLGATNTTANNRIAIDVAANGSAAWTIQYRVQLDDANETAAFDALRTEITTNPAAYRDRFSQRLTDTAASAEVTTGREMAIANVRVNASQEGDIGIVTYRFEWRNFVATNGDGLQIGDALAGFFIENGTRLMIAWPDGYEATTIQPPPDSRQPHQASWDAPTGFSEDDLLVEVTRTEADTGVDGSDAEGGAGGSVSSEDGIPIAGIVTGAILLLIGGTIVIWLHRRRERSTSGVATGSELEMDDAEETATTGSSASIQSDNGDDASDKTSPDVELLSNEERVIETLRQLGGRAKQQRVVEELGWTDAKTSQVVSRLREDGSIEGFRLGRENVLILPEKPNDEDESE